ncbi:hypothetical protein I4F81_001496 [Pyropia yezoensis]|uniref:Uncharacterized protein n=1 Tax=Pyropia yezoensis TaxID=2788 RepID=A0ACC3BMC2_PYRYE|nr:hypothetical protein I4F81_001496 [Neopyropia yezoensis]
MGDPPADEDAPGSAADWYHPGGQQDSGGVGTAKAAAAAATAVASASLPMAGGPSAAAGGVPAGCLCYAWQRGVAATVDAVGWLGDAAAAAVGGLSESCLGGASILGTYRSLLRAQRAAFTGDAPLQAAACRSIRDAFAADRGLADDAAVAAKLRDARDAVAFLANNIKQAPLTRRGNYAVDAAEVNDPRRPGSG